MSPLTRLLLGPDRKLRAPPGTGPAAAPRVL